MDEGSVISWIREVPLVGDEGNDTYGAIRFGLRNTNSMFADDEWNIRTVYDSYTKAADSLRMNNKILTREAEVDLLEIATDGTLEGKGMLYTPQRHNYQDTIVQRRKLMSIYSTNPDLAHDIVKNDVMVGHGSTSASLLGVLDDGLRPQKYLEERGSIIGSGEGIFGSADVNREHVSTAQWWIGLSERYVGRGEEITTEILEESITGLKQSLKEMRLKKGDIGYDSVAIKIKHLQKTLAYLEANPQGQSLQADLIRENFPVVYLASGKNITRENTAVTGMSGEIAVRDGIATKDIPVILVPKDKIGVAQNLVQEKGRDIIVYALEDFLENDY